MTQVTQELIDSTYDAITMMRLFSQRLSEGEVDDREASEMSWLLGRARLRLEPVSDLLEALEYEARSGESKVDADLLALGSEVLALHEKFRQRRQGLGGAA